jgi:Arc/MetJ-type ribon-helix-helix transcriptional regulator
VNNKVDQGLYVDGAEVVRDALRRMRCVSTDEKLKAFLGIWAKTTLSGNSIPAGMDGLFELV